MNEIGHFLAFSIGDMDIETISKGSVFFPPKLYGETGLPGD